MMFSRCFLFVLLATMAVTATAQTDPAAIPNWNGIQTVERYDTPSFTPLNLADPTTTHLQGSESRSSGDPMMNVTVPFPFLFFHHVYPASTLLRVGINGVIAVDPTQGTPTYSIGPYYLSSAPYSSYPADMLQNLLAPFWGDLTAVGVPNGGIWTSLDNPADPQVLTIEWHVRPQYGPGGEGVFQVRFVRTSGNSSIEYLYDPTHPISLPQIGAFIGMKRVGQGIGNPGPLVAGQDDPKLLIYTEGDYPGFPDIFFTRLPTRNQPTSGPYTPDWYSGYSSSGTPTGPIPSPLFHYGFPNKSYRSKPIESDIIALNGSVYKSPIPSDSTADTTFIEYGGSRWVAIRCYNASLLPLSDIPIKAIIGHNGNTVTTLLDTIPLLGSGDSVIKAFPTALDTTIITGPGTYDVSVIADYSGDGYHGNDTARFRFYVRDTSDIAPVSITVPSLSTFPIRSYEAVGVPIPITGRFINSGLRTEHDVVVGWRILTGDGTLVAQRTDTLYGQWDTMQVKEKVFQPWTPPAAGLYRLKIFSSLSGDLIGENDSLDVPTIDIVAPGYPVNPSAIPVYYFGVLSAIDLSVMASPGSPDLPFAGQTYSGSVPVRVLVNNDGSEDMTNASIHVLIRDASSTVVYDEMMTVPFIAEGHGSAMASFPDFNPLTTGEYCIEAVVPHNGDANPGNNTATWCFSVVGSDAGTSASEPEIVSIIVAPNPARSTALLEYRLPNGKEGQVALYDMYGRRTDAVEERTLHGSGSIVLRADALPSGTYTVQMILSDGTRTARMLTIVH